MVITQANIKFIFKMSDNYEQQKKELSQDEKDFLDKLDVEHKILEDEENKRNKEIATRERINNIAKRLLDIYDQYDSK